MTKYIKKWHYEMGGTRCRCQICTVENGKIVDTECHMKGNAAGGGRCYPPTVDRDNRVTEETEAELKESGFQIMDPDTTCCYL